MRKCLYINQKLPTILVQEMLSLLIVDSSAWKNGWIYNMYYQFEIDNGYIAISKKDYMDGKGCFICYSYRFPVNRSRNYAELDDSDVVSMLKSLIDKEIYLEAIYSDTKIISQILIYGYDDGQQGFLMYIFEENHYKKSILLYEKILDRILEEIFGQPDGRVEFYGYKRNAFFHEKFSISIMQEQLELLLQKREKVKGGIIALSDILIFLKQLCSNGKEDKLRKSVQSIIQHLLFMQERLNYFFVRFELSQSMKEMLENIVLEIQESSKDFFCIASGGNDEDKCIYQKNIDEAFGRLNSVYQHLYTFIAENAQLIREK